MTSKMYLVPLRGADPDRRPPPDFDVGTIGRGSLQPVVVRSPAGRSLLVFSGVEEVRRWREVARFVSVPANEIEPLARRAHAHEIVCDTAGPVRRRQSVAATGDGGPLGPFDIRGLPNPLSVGAIQTIREELTTRPQVEAAWVVEATVDGHDVLVLAFDTASDSLDPEAVVRSLVPSIVAQLPAERYAGVQVVLLTDEDVRAAVEAADEPIFRRV